MRIIYLGKFVPFAKSFYFGQKGFPYVSRIIPSDINNLEDIESNIVRKIIKTVYRNKDQRGYNIYYKDY
jgi:hypothetical protein